MKTFLSATAIALALTAPAFADNHATTADKGMITMDKGDFAQFDAPTLEVDGFTQIGMDKFTSEDLTGTRLYDINNEWIGEVDSIVMNSNGDVTGAVLGVGGWLGVGEKDVLVSFDSLTIKQETDGDEMRIYADVTKEVLEALPAFEVDS